MENSIIDVRKCGKKEPPHPCDPPLVCDPLVPDDDPCLEPYICLERLKNPAWPGEITRCLSGEFIYANRCKRDEPPHPCDPKPPCSQLKVHKKQPCNEPPLCLERIKNPENRKKTDPSCDPTK